MATRVQIIQETSLQREDWARCLSFQWCRYVYPDGRSECGYRFIWRKEDGSLQPARGQARLPSVKIIEELVQIAKEEGWGENIGELGE